MVSWLTVIMWRECLSYQGNWIGVLVYVHNRRVAGELFGPCVTIICSIELFLAVPDYGGTSSSVSLFITLPLAWK
jgi:hypothetical protein